MEWSFEARDNYLYAVITGAYDYEGIIEFCHAADDELYKSGYNKLLINLQKMTGRASTVQQYNIGKLIGTLKVRARTAAVPNMETADSFVTTVAQNRGSDINIFPDEEKALAWLMG